jgi:hypothetical protein
MTHQEHLESYLRKHSHRFFCSACLAHEIGVTPPVGRSIMWTLQALPEYEMRGSKCLGCLRGKRAIRYVGGHNIVGAAAHVALFLLSNEGIYLCDGCLALATEISLLDVRGVLTDLTPLTEFDRRVGHCTVCVRHTDITAAFPIDPAHADAIASVATGSVPYGGWRIDLLSYGTTEGWRPFVLIKGPDGAKTTDAPSVLPSVLATKADADAAALRDAKAWIDTQSSR